MRFNKSRYVILDTEFHKMWLDQHWRWSLEAKTINLFGKFLNLQFVWLLNIVLKHNL